MCQNLVLPPADRKVRQPHQTPVRAQSVAAELNLGANLVAKVRLDRREILSATYFLKKDDSGS